MINIVHTWNFMDENDHSYELLLFIVWYFGSWLWTPRDHVIMADIFMSSWMLSWPLSCDHTFTPGLDLMCPSSWALNSDDFPFFWILYCSSRKRFTAVWSLVNICWNFGQQILTERVFFTMLPITPQGVKVNFYTPWCKSFHHSVKILLFEFGFTFFYTLKCNCEVNYYTQMCSFTLAGEKSFTDMCKVPNWLQSSVLQKRILNISMTHCELTSQSLTKVNVVSWC